MSDLIQFPFTRQQYAAIDNPRYVSDIVAANQEVFAMAKAILGDTSFAILGGLDYVVPISGSAYYTAGFFYLNGVFYYQPATFNEHLYLKANITGIMPYTFSDAVIRDLYQVNYSQSTNVSTGATPQFTGNMNAYRFDLTYITTQISILQTATNLEVIQVAVLPSSYTINFTNDKSIFFASATVNTSIHFDFTNAIPGTVITMKWTFASTETLSIPAASGQTILLESGDQTNVGNNINILTMLYAGINDIGDSEVRIVLSQPVIPT